MGKGRGASFRLQWRFTFVNVRERERKSCFFAMLKFGSGSRSGLD